MIQLLRDPKSYLTEIFFSFVGHTHGVQINNLFITFHSDNSVFDSFFFLNKQTKVCITHICFYSGGVINVGISRRELSFSWHVSVLRCIFQQQEAKSGQVIISALMSVTVGLYDVRFFITSS